MLGKKMNPKNLWVEPVGSIILARLRGACTSEILLECQERVLALAKDSQHVKVLYDTLETEPPSVDLVLLQQHLESEKKACLDLAFLQSAILVPNTRIAYLSRIAFGQHGEQHYRVFYNDMVQAIKWLEEGSP